MVALGRRAEIARLNREHPLCVACDSFLQGYEPSSPESLRPITLMRCVYLWEMLLMLPRRQGFPSLKEVEEALGFLDRAPPRKALRYLTHIGDKEVLVVAEIERAENIMSAAGSLMQVLTSQLMLGASLPE